MIGVEHVAHIGINKKIHTTFWLENLSGRQYLCKTLFGG